MSYEYPSEGQDPWYEGLQAGLDQIDANALASGRSVKEVAYGAVGNGLSDDTNAIQAALTEAGFQGGNVVFPSGTYLVNDTLQVPTNVHVWGVGSSATFIQMGATDKDVFVISGSGDTPVRAGIHNLRVVGPASGTGRGVVISALDNFFPAYGGVIDRVYVEHMGSHGFYFDGTFETQINHCDAWDNGGHGFYLDGGDATPSGTFLTSMQLNTCYSNHNTGWGFYTRKGTYLAFTTCAADNNVLGGYYFYDVSAVTLTSCGAESPDDPDRQISVGKQPYGFKFGGSPVYGTSGVSLIGCYCYGITKIPFWFAPDTSPSVGRVDATMIGCRELTTDLVNSEFQYGLDVLNGAYVTVIGCTLPGAPASNNAKSMIVQAGGKALVLAPADPAGNALGMSYNLTGAPTLFPGADSIIVAAQGTGQVPLVVKAAAGQTTSVFKTTDVDGNNRVSVTMFANGQLTFGTDETIVLERPVGKNQLSVNAPLRLPTFTGTAAALETAFPPANFQNSIMTWYKDSDHPMIMMSNGVHWVTANNGYWQNASTV